MNLSLVAAINRSNVLGIDGKIPWHNKDDLKNFKRLTWGHAVIMGRNTYESIGKPLPGRLNYVLSSRPLRWKSNLIRIENDYWEYFHHIKDEIFVIGGASIYRQLAPMISKIYLTIIDDYTDASTAVYFPWEAFDVNSWKVMEQRNWKDATYLVMSKNYA